MQRTIWLAMMLAWLIGCAQSGTDGAPLSDNGATVDDEPAATVIQPDTGMAGGSADAEAPSYVTPRQQEGPYYTVDKPADRDNDLTVVDGAAGAPAGTPLVFGGTVYDAAGTPLAGIVIEIWQTDDQGVYLHPGDPNSDRRDLNFQFYGEATTAADGSYQFRTILPGEYEPRPRHIHVKVKDGDRELLTTQFYFEGATLGAAAAGGAPEPLVITLVEAADDAGNPILQGTRDIVLP